MCVDGKYNLIIFKVIFLTSTALNNYRLPVQNIIYPPAADFRLVIWSSSGKD
jgi:hypothetical protein